MVVVNQANFKVLNRFCTALLALFFTVCASASEPEPVSPLQWLERMSAALQQQNYQGVFIYRRADDLAAMKVTHVADEQGTREMLETLTGEKRSELRFTPPVRADGSHQFASIDHYYSLQLLGNDRAAGRITQVVSVLPRDEYRYGYRLWLDQATVLLLKSDLLNQKGDVIQQVMFTSLELLSPEQVADAIDVDNSFSMPAPVTNIESMTPKVSWIVENLPKGFVLLDAYANSPNKGFDHSVYSDGMASVSVFIERTKSDGEAFEGVSRMGAVSAFGNVYAGYQITVVGDVPEVTVTSIGKSIRLGDAQ